jgi:hypothetical protein
LWQNEHRKASSDPARFKQFSPLPPWVLAAGMLRTTPSSLSPEWAFLAMYSDGKGIGEGNTGDNR